MDVRCCPRCGQTLPPGNPADILSARQLVIFALIKNAGEEGIKVNKIVEYLYAGDPEGGPLWATTVVYRTVFVINQKLKANGVPLKLAAAKSGNRTYQPYRLLPA